MVCESRSHYIDIYSLVLVELPIFITFLFFPCGQLICFCNFLKGVFRKLQIISMNSAIKWLNS